MSPVAARHGRGFTLMEALVTLVVVSIVSTLIWQALAQAARVERLLDSGALEPQTEALRVQWVRRTIESLVPLAEDERDRFQGSETRMRGLASEVPGWPASPAAAFELELRHEAASLHGELLLRLEGDSDTPVRVSVPVLRWQGGPGSLQYLASDGQWHASWPAPTVSGGSPRALPVAVAVVMGASPMRVIVAAPRSGGTPLITRAMLERQ